jgi:hypothetical protein
MNAKNLLFAWKNDADAPKGRRSPVTAIVSIKKASVDFKVELIVTLINFSEAWSVVFR